MFAIEPGDSVTDTDLRDRARAGFRALVLDGSSRGRLLAKARERAGAAGTPSWTGKTLRISIVVVVAAVILAMIALQPALRSKWTAPERPVTAAFVLSRALAAVSAPGEVLHVIAVTSYGFAPVPTPKVATATVLTGLVATLPQESTHRHGPPDPRIFASLRRLESEHWLDPSGDRRHSINLAISSADIGGDWDRVRYDVLQRDGIRTKYDSGRSRGNDATSSWVSVTDLPDYAPFFGQGDIADPRNEGPDAQLMDTADPGLYYSLLSSAALTAPPDVDGKPAIVHTTATLLGDAVVDGVPVYRLRIVNFWSPATKVPWPIETSVVADVRRSDYLPVRVQGETGGRTWTTTYTTMETIPRSHVPSSAFGIDIPAGTLTRVSHRIKAGDVASATPVPISWLGRSFEGLRFTGYFRHIVNFWEYEEMREPDSAPVQADNDRPAINTDQVIAEYTANGGPGNMNETYSTDLKVISMPRTGRKVWDSTLAQWRKQFLGREFAAKWTTIDGHPALLLDHGGIWGKSRISIGYLIVDTGTATVMLQGANSAPGQLERAAKAMVRAK